MSIDLNLLNNLEILEFIEKAEKLLLPQRRQTILKVLNERIASIRIVLEDIYDPLNANAVIRTADAIGLQFIDVVENWNKFAISPGVTRGCTKWMSLRRFNQKGENNSKACFKKLKEEGFIIYATTLRKKTIELGDIDKSQKIAIVFGSERDGISQYAFENADEFLQIPMRGFSESLNISVSAGILLERLTQMARKSPDNFLSGDLKNRIYADWLKKNIKAFRRR